MKRKGGVSLSYVVTMLRNPRWREAGESSGWNAWWIGGLGDSGGGRIDEVEFGRSSNPAGREDTDVRYNGGTRAHPLGQSSAVYSYVAGMGQKLGVY